MGGIRARGIFAPPLPLTSGQSVSLFDLKVFLFKKSYKLSKRVLLQPEVSGPPTPLQPHSLPSLPCRLILQQNKATAPRESGGRGVVVEWEGLKLLTKVKPFF